jgi:hypothetical protein
MAAYRLAVVCDRLKTRASAGVGLGTGSRAAISDPGESSQILRTPFLRSKLPAALLRTWLAR